MFKKIKEAREKRKAVKLMQEQTAILTFEVLTRFYSLLKMFTGDVDVDTVVALADQLKGVGNEEIIKQILDKIEEEKETEEDE